MAPKLSGAAFSFPCANRTRFWRPIQGIEHIQTVCQTQDNAGLCTPPVSIQECGFVLSAVGIAHVSYRGCHYHTFPRTVFSMLGTVLPSLCTTVYFCRRVWKRAASRRQTRLPVSIFTRTVWYCSASSSIDQARMLQPHITPTNCNTPHDPVKARKRANTGNYVTGVKHNLFLPSVSRRTYIFQALSGFFAHGLEPCLSMAGRAERVSGFRFAHGLETVVSSRTYVGIVRTRARTVCPLPNTHVCVSGVP